MTQYERERLNIKRLLALGDLDIRGMAEKDGTLTADDYFSKVEQFIETIPQVWQLFGCVSDLEANIKALKELEEKLGVTGRSSDKAEHTKTIDQLKQLKETLHVIGYTPMDFLIDGLCTAITSSNFKLAEKLSNEALTKFAVLSDRLKSTYTVKKFAKAEDNTEEKPSNPALLSEALAYFDYEEENRKLRILAVDDVPVVLNTITSVLSPYYEVYALKNSSHVEKFLTHTTPELFLLDIEMNEYNGFELVPMIRRFKEHQDTPIIFLTGNASFSNLRDAIALGACDFISKPVNRDTLLDKIQKKIVRKKAY